MDDKRLQQTLDDIPIHAFQPKPDICRIHTMKEWWCPDCGAHDEGEADFIEEWGNGVCYETRERRVDYCCIECFEDNIYVTLEEG